MRLMLLLLPTSLFVAGSLHAYTVIPNKWPGFVRGTVKLQGTPPELALLPPAPAAAGCGTDGLPDDTLQVQKDGRLANALAWLDIEQGKDSLKRSVGVDLKDCRLQPRMATMTVGEELSVGNLDDGFRNLRVMFLPPSLEEPARGLTNAGLPEDGQRVKVKAAAPGWLVVRGEGTHGFCRSFVRVFAHPYHAVTAIDGAFDLRDVPPGSYTLNVWHERFGSVSAPVEVKAGYVTRQDMSLQATALVDRPWSVGTIEPDRKVAGAGVGTR